MRDNRQGDPADTGAVTGAAPRWRSLENVEIAEDDPQKDEQQDGADHTTAELPGPNTRDCTS